MSEPLAHSARVDRGVPAQTYREHVTSVRLQARKGILSALRYYRDESAWMVTYAEWGATFHDLGKLVEENQEVLRGEAKTRHLPVDHVDAGSAHLRSLGLMESALAVYSHHLGLADLPAEQAKEVCGDPSAAALRDIDIRLRTDEECPALIDLHHRNAGADPGRPPGKAPSLSGLDRRVLLSCLVDADHGDTARHAGEESEVGLPEPRWAERLGALDRYVAGLPGSNPERDAVRARMYSECRNSEATGPLLSCESPVGTGKTTAVMAYLLRVAQQAGLRHVFVVLPYTNIINQAVKVYRDALVLGGEDPERVVAAHHHQAEFGTMDARYLTTLWRAPVIVTTAVQFFETLAAAATPSLRKLHELPGSAVFIDEAHAAMRIELWPYMWDRLKDLGERWGCRFVLGSGSLVRFWEDGRIMQGQAERIPPLIPGCSIRQAEEAEKTRICYRSRAAALTLDQLCDWVGAARGPRVVVMNTVQSAAVLARALQRRGIETQHLSTALVPVDRSRILERVKARLKADHDGDFVLVATSCVEAGIDLSFAVGFRERSRVASLIQLGGRVNRHGERGASVVWDFVCGGEEFTIHPEYKHSRPVVEEVFRNNGWALSPGDVATYALAEEFKRASGHEAISRLRKAERVGCYPEVAHLARLIQTDTRLVMIGESVVARVKARTATAQDIREHSVQLWGDRIRSLALREVLPGSEMYLWPYEYDSDLIGVMSGILGQKAIDRRGFAIV
jgi:CRISPR-associated endonuclease/helicase Cas3